MQIKPRQYHIFCCVIDNFGDIGICWRLARQLVLEHDLRVVLWVDDLNSFQRICPDIDPSLPIQQQVGVSIRHWGTTMPHLTPDLLPDVIVEALACNVPSDYLAWVESQHHQAIWLNLEYLSAEDWVEGCHGLPSPQPGRKLPKYFFFPGFTERTGGLLREQGLLPSLDKLSACETTTLEFLSRILPFTPSAEQLKISLFAYQHQAIAEFLQQLAQQTQPVLLLVPDGALARQIRHLWPQLHQQATVQQQQLTVHILQFLPQPDYDRLLAACDLNFVRGEDSIIRAQWAAKPFIWQIYRQDEQAHVIKLQAFLKHYLREAPPALALLLQQVFFCWEDEQPFAELLPDLLTHLPLIRQFNLQWRNFLHAQQDLASNLVRFAEKNLIMARNFS